MNNQSVVGMMGGAFDPIHKGHVSLIRAALRVVPRLILMPTGLPPHKNLRLMPSRLRLAMVQRAVEDIEGVEVSQYEIQRPGMYSYTSETVRKLKESMRRRGISDPKVVLFFGSDSLETLHTWHEPQAILAQADMAIALRGTEGREQKEALQAKAHQLMDTYGGRIFFIEAEPVDCSSTQLRAQLKKGIVDERYLPAKVAEFLRKNQPYRLYDSYAALAPQTQLRLAQYEQKSWEWLTEKRAIHSVNVMLMAGHLAQCHGVDSMKATMVGLLHDLFKAQSMEEQRLWARKRSPIRYLRYADTIHGPAAAAFLDQCWGIHDPEILRAIHYHTTCSSVLSPLDQILYLSDKIEYGRPFRGLTELRQAAETNLEQAMELCLQEVLKALKRQEKNLHPLTRKCLQTRQIEGYR